MLLSLGAAAYTIDLANHVARGQTLYTVGFAVRAFLATILMLAAISKIQTPSSLRATLHTLNLPGAGAIAALLPVVELIAATCIVLPQTAVIGAGLCGLLGLSFAGAAGLAVLRQEEVRCSCFGASDARLGWKQFAALPLWLLTSGVAIASRHAVPAVTGLMALCSAAVVVTAIMLARLADSWDRLRLDRRSFADDSDLDVVESLLVANPHSINLEHINGSRFARH